MIGAILGDIIGSPYEFDANNIKTKDFELFSDSSEFTDDSIMTLAVADGIMNSSGQSDEEIKTSIIKSMKRVGRPYRGCGYGGRFYKWIYGESSLPYNSLGNGSAMRVSSAAWLAGSLNEARRLARLSAEVTHNHIEGIKGAESVASAIFLARIGSSKEEIKEYVEREFGYDLSRSCDDIRPHYHHVETCMETVPEAFAAFLEGESFEDVIRCAVSLGGDSDTLTAIAGSIAEGFYGVPRYLERIGKAFLDDNLLEILDRFEKAKADFI